MLSIGIWVCNVSKRLPTRAFARRDEFSILAASVYGLAKDLGTAEPDVEVFYQHYQSTTFFECSQFQWCDSATYFECSQFQWCDSATYFECSQFQWCDSATYFECSQFQWCDSATYFECSQFQWCDSATYFILL